MVETRHGMASIDEGPTVVGQNGDQDRVQAVEKRENGDFELSMSSGESLVRRRSVVG
ncbi:hypothetical protein COLO4_08605 [Corchorus olitorius]|uniref:Uncharacterized protein n=1 Tax=Corchorus olitorius TaxID=93759 RepID=A0A1R3KFB8_9ROSI|nr:hypothetical protein COLO4_08605 [Corchorus olitorius]